MLKLNIFLASILIVQSAGVIAEEADFTSCKDPKYLDPCDQYNHTIGSSFLTYHDAKSDLYKKLDLGAVFNTGEAQIFITAYPSFAPAWLIMISETDDGRGHIEYAQSSILLKGNVDNKSLKINALYIDADMLTDIVNIWESTLTKVRYQKKGCFTVDGALFEFSGVFGDPFFMCGITSSYGGHNAPSKLAEISILLHDFVVEESSENREILLNSIRNKLKSF